MRMARLGRRRCENFPGSFDCDETGPKRLSGEVLGSWLDSEDPFFGTYMGRNTFQAILSNLQVSDGT